MVGGDRSDGLYHQVGGWGWKINWNLLNCREFQQGFYWWLSYRWHWRLTLKWISSWRLTFWWLACSFLISYYGIRIWNDSKLVWRGHVVLYIEYMRAKTEWIGCDKKNDEVINEIFLRKDLSYLELNWILTAGVGVRKKRGWQGKHMGGLL